MGWVMKNEQYVEPNPSILIRLIVGEHFQQKEK